MKTPPALPLLSLCTIAWLVSASAFVGAACEVCAAPIVQKDDVVAVCGDSLTDQKEYSVFIEDYLLMCQPVPGVRALECGWGGSTLPHLASHMGGDVMTFSPNVAVVTFGINDGNANVLDEKIASAYRNGMEKVIANFQQGHTRAIVVSSPAAVDSFYFRNTRHADVTAAQFNQTLGQMAEIAKDVTAAKGAVLSDVHAPMMKAMTESKAKYGERYPFSSETDGVHGGPNYHLVIAYACLKALGFDGQIGTITYDAATGQAEATDGHRIVSSQPGQVVVESSRYPFCFFNGTQETRETDAPDAPPQSQFAGDWKHGDAAILPFVPFNEDLNRYVLVVKNLKSPRAKITWGEQTKEFSAKDLAQGINLAAEFLRNPFVKAFAAVERTIIDKQSFETDFIGHYLYNQPGLRKRVPEQGAALDEVESGFRKVHAAMQENCRKAVKPVTHAIKIEELAGN